MNYYIQGNKEKADQIKAAFEQLGYDISWPEGCANPDVINIGVERNGAKYVVAETAAYIRDIIKTHPDYKELKLPVEPKFKVGDWVACIDDEGDMATEKIVTFLHNKVLLVDTDGCLAEYPKTELSNFHLWSIQDAKDGDVLAINWHEDNDSWEKIIIFKNYHAKGVKGLIKQPCVEGYGNTFKNGKLAFREEVPYYSRTWTDNLQPATKEQRNLLFQKMKENGCEWDAEKKELRKIKPNYDISNFKPFDKVLVRCSNDEEWMIEFYCKYDTLVHTSPHRDYPFMGIGDSYSQCIPFEGNEHLLGTTDMCDEMYINW